MLQQIKYNQRWTKSSIKQIKNNIASNKRSQTNVLVRPAKLGYDWKKALPSQPAQTWPRFLRPSHHREETVHYISTTDLLKIIHQLNSRDITVQLKPSEVAWRQFPKEMSFLNFGL